jgi:predicted small metal-binding protein
MQEIEKEIAELISKELTKFKQDCINAIKKNAEKVNLQ